MPQKKPKNCLLLIHTVSRIVCSCAISAAMLTNIPTCRTWRCLPFVQHDISLPSAVPFAGIFSLFLSLFLFFFRRYISPSFDLFFSTDSWIMWPYRETVGPTKWEKELGQINFLKKNKEIRTVSVRFWKFGFPIYVF